MPYVTWPYVWLVAVFDWRVGLSHCRHLKTVRTHLTGLVHSDIILPDSPTSSGGGLTEDLWRSMSQSGEVLGALSILYCVSFFIVLNCIVFNCIVLLLNCIVFNCIVLLLNCIVLCCHVIIFYCIIVRAVPNISDYQYLDLLFSRIQMRIVHKCKQKFQFKVSKLIPWVPKVVFFLFFGRCCSSAAEGALYGWTVDVDDVGWHMQKHVSCDHYSFSVRIQNSYFAHYSAPKWIQSECSMQTLLLYCLSCIELYFLLNCIV